MSVKLRIMAALLLVVAGADQATKWWIENNVSPFDPLVVIEGFFQLTHARNSGIALGLFQGTHWAVFVALTSCALALIVYFYRQTPADDKLSALALGLIVGGAVGNLIDRVFRREVIDWVQFDLGLFVFPDFNVADSAIVIGVGLLLLDAVVSEVEESAPGEPEPSLFPGRSVP